MTEPTRYYYRFTCGTREFSAYGLDDRRARRLLDRWIRLCWPAWKASRRAGSMADSEDNGWHKLPEATISRIRLLPGDVVPCQDFLQIESFEVCPETISEFSRAYGSY